MTFIANAIAAILSWFGLKSLEIAKKFAMFVILVGINGALLTSFLAYLGLIISLILWLYKKFNDLLSFINSPPNSEILAVSFRMLKASGIWDGAVDAFSLLSVGFVMLFVAFLTRIIIKAFLHFRFTIISLIMAIK